MAYAVLNIGYNNGYNISPYNGLFQPFYALNNIKKQGLHFCNPLTIRAVDEA